MKTLSVNRFQSNIFYILHYIPPSSTLYTPLVYIIYPPRLHYIPPSSTLYTPLVYIIYPPRLHYIPPSSTLYTPLVYIIYPPRLHYIPPSSTFFSTVFVLFCCFLLNPMLSILHELLNTHPPFNCWQNRPN